MKCYEVIECLSELAPFEYAEKWDNVGLLLGRKDKEISRIFVAVDASDEVVEEAIEKGCDMLLTHHPLIFSPMKRIVEDDFIGQRIIKLIKNDISYVAMHTNFDIMGMADAAADELSLKHTDVLQITFEDDIDKAGFGRVGDLPREMSLSELSGKVKLAFQVPSVRVFGELDTVISRVAILPGSGKSGIEDALACQAEVYITGDIDHHAGIDAVARGLCIIDAGHYGIEKLFISYMRDYISRNMKHVQVETESIREPFVAL